MFTIPNKLKWALSLVIKTILSVSNSNIVSANLCHLTKSFCSSFNNRFIRMEMIVQVHDSESRSIWYLKNECAAYRQRTMAGFYCLSHSFNVFRRQYSLITSPCSFRSQRSCSLKTIHLNNCSQGTLVATILKYFLAINDTAEYLV